MYKYHKTTTYLYYYSSAVMPSMIYGTNKFDLNVSIQGCFLFYKYIYAIIHLVMEVSTNYKYFIYSLVAHRGTTNVTIVES